MFEVNGKYAGRSRAVVIDNKDPNKRGRVRVRHPILGDTVWINYLKNPSFFDAPKIGDVVYLEADCGFDTHPVASGNIVKGKDGDLDIPEEFQRIDPTNRGIYTPGGHLLEFDDGQTEANLGKGVRLTTSGGIKIHALEGNPAESKVLIEMPNGIKIEADGITDSIKAQVAFGDSLELSAAGGFQVNTPAAGGTSLSMNGGQISISNALAAAVIALNGTISLGGPVGNAVIANDGNVSISSGTASLVITPAGQVELKGASDGLVDLLIQAFQALSTQTAPGFGAPTSTVADFAQLLVKATALKAP